MTLQHFFLRMWVVRVVYTAISPVLVLATTSLLGTFSSVSFLQYL